MHIEQLSDLNPIHYEHPQLETNSRGLVIKAIALAALAIAFVVLFHQSKISFDSPLMVAASGAATLTALILLSLRPQNNKVRYALYVLALGLLGVVIGFSTQPPLLTGGILGGALFTLGHMIINCRETKQEEIDTTANRFFSLGNVDLKSDATTFEELRKEFNSKVVTHPSLYCVKLKEGGKSRLMTTKLNDTVTILIESNDGKFRKIVTQSLLTIYDLSDVKRVICFTSNLIEYLQDPVAFFKDKRTPTLGADCRAHVDAQLTAINAERESVCKGMGNISFDFKLFALDVN